LGIPQATGYDYYSIKQAFDEVMNFLTLPNQPFGTGVFSYTQSGMDHFVDCKVLFDLNAIVLAISGTITITILILKKLGKVTLVRPFGMDVSFISALSIFVLFAVLGGVIAIDFDNAFIVFHHIFFPGKDNWQFSYADEIIKALPQQFFMNCAILIGASIIIISLTIIIFQLIKKAKNKKTDKKA
jgi:integral membrane protein (TIGR01906 family)